jgi:hypothetical protein
MNRFYVYVIYDVNNLPIYVGKGTGRRAYNSFKRSDNVAVRNCKTKNRVNIIADKLTEDEAFSLEVKLITEYGRKCNKTGTLYNLTDGGEGASGFEYTTQHIIKRYHNRRPSSIIDINSGEIIHSISLGDAARKLSIILGRLVSSTCIHALLNGKVQIIYKRWKLYGKEIMYNHTVKEKSIELKNIHTGEIFYFKSASAAAKKLDITVDDICNLRKTRTLLANKCWSLVDTDLNLINDRFKNRTRNSLKKNIEIMDNITKKILEFSSQKEAAEKLDCNPSDVSMLRRGIIKSIKNKRYTII